jgi:hypothetical protein
MHGTNILFHCLLSQLSVPYILITNRKCTAEYQYHGQLVYVSTTQVLHFNPLTLNDIYIYIYMSYRTANLQTLYFVYLVNKYTY